MLGLLILAMTKMISPLTNSDCLFVCSILYFFVSFITIFARYARFYVRILGTCTQIWYAAVGTRFRPGRYALTLVRRYAF